MNQGVTALTYAVRPLVVAKYIGQLAVMLAILSLAPLGASLLFGEYALAVRHAIVIVLLLAVAVPTASQQGAVQFALRIIDPITLAQSVEVVSLPGMQTAGVFQGIKHCAVLAEAAVSL